MYIKSLKDYLLEEEQKKQEEKPKIGVYTYFKLSPVSAKKLYDWCHSIGLVDVTTPDDMHVSFLSDREFPFELYQKLENVSVVAHPPYKLFIDETVIKYNFDFIVLGFLSSDLDFLFKKQLRRHPDLKTNFASANLWHITLSFNPNQEKAIELKNLDLKDRPVPDFNITLTGEYAVVPNDVRYDGLTPRARFLANARKLESELEAEKKEKEEAEQKKKEEIYKSKVVPEPPNPVPGNPVVRPMPGKPVLNVTPGKPMPGKPDEVLIPKTLFGKEVKKIKESDDLYFNQIMRYFNKE